MKPLIEKLPLNEDGSFVARIYRTPYFEVPWHQHVEYELILFLEENWGIQVADIEMVPDNLDSVAAITAYVQRKQAA